MSKVKFDIEECKGCEYCIKACPFKVLRMSEGINKKGYHYAEAVNADKCTNCGLCYRVCPDAVIEVE